MSKSPSNNPANGASEASFLVGQFLKTTEALKNQIGLKLEVNETDYRALSLLMSKGSMTPGVLSEKVGLTSGSTTTMIERLIKVGHVVREASETDGRSSVISIKPKSAKLAAELITPIIKMSDNALDGMSKSEVEAVLKFLRNINQNGKAILDNLEKRKP